MEEDPFVKRLAQEKKVPEGEVREFLRVFGIKTNAERCADIARKYFNKASSTTGQERINNAQAIWNMKDLLSPEEFRIVLSNLLTTPEAIQELIRKGREEDRAVNSLRAKIKRLFSA